MQLVCGAITFTAVPIQQDFEAFWIVGGNFVLGFARIRIGSQRAV
jgi:hypothetical protein